MTPSPCDVVVSCGISTCFQVLSPCMGQIAHALLTRPPLKHLEASSLMSPLDLHVLGTPPAFVLSQDQTLMFNPLHQPAPTGQWRFLLVRNLTVLSALPSLYRFQGSLPSPLRPSLSLAPLATTLTIILTPPLFVNSFFQFPVI